MSGHAKCHATTSFVKNSGKVKQKYRTCFFSSAAKGKDTKIPGYGQKSDLLVLCMVCYSAAGSCTMIWGFCANDRPLRGKTKQARHAEYKRKRV